MPAIKPKTCVDAKQYPSDTHQQMQCNAASIAANTITHQPKSMQPTIVICCKKKEITVIFFDIALLKVHFHHKQKCNATQNMQMPLNMMQSSRNCCLHTCNATTKTCKCHSNHNLQKRKNKANHGSSLFCVFFFFFFLFFFFFWCDAGNQTTNMCWSRAMPSCKCNAMQPQLLLQRNWMQHIVCDCWKKWQKNGVFCFFFCFSWCATIKLAVLNNMPMGFMLSFFKHISYCANSQIAWKTNENERKWKRKEIKMKEKNKRKMKTTIKTN